MIDTTSETSGAAPRRAVGAVCLLSVLFAACGGGYAPPAGAQTTAGIERITVTASRHWVLSDDRDFVVLEVNVIGPGGTPVPDGTEVSIAASHGRLEESTLQTTNGRAQVRLYSGADADVDAVVFAFVAGRRSEESETVTITKEGGVRDTGSKNAHISAGDYLAFRENGGLLVGYGNVQFEFRRIKIVAEHLRLSVFAPYALKAEEATVSNGTREFHARNLYMEFRPNETLGVAFVLEPTARVMSFVNEDFAESAWWPPEDKFRMGDLPESTVVIKCGTAILFPGEKLVLRPARIYYDDTHVLTMAAHIVGLNGVGGAVEAFPQLVGFTYPGGVFVDYPYYFVTSDRYTGAARLRHGSPAGMFTGRTGWYGDVDFQYRDESGGEGGLYVDGLGQKDFGARWSHNQEYNERTRGSYSLAWPQNRYLSAYGNVFTQNRGSSHMLSANWFAGQGFPQSWAVESAWRFDPVKLGGLQLGYGATAGWNLDSWTQESYGRAGLSAALRPAKPWRAAGRLTVSPRAIGEIDRHTNGSSEWNTVLGAEASLPFSKLGSLALGYDIQNREGGPYLNGVRHTLQGRLSYFGSGSATWSAMLAAVQDFDNSRLTAYAWATWEFAPKWVLGLNGTLYKTPLYQFNDLSLSVGRRIGQAEARVLYSSSRHRWEAELTRMTGSL